MNGDNGEMLFVATEKNSALSGTASLIWRELKPAVWQMRIGGQARFTPAAAAVKASAALTQAVFAAAGERHRHRQH